MVWRETAFEPIIFIRKHYVVIYPPALLPQFSHQALSSFRVARTESSFGPVLLSDP